MRLLYKIFEALKIDEESHADNESHWMLKNVLALYTSLLLVLCTHS